MFLITISTGVYLEMEFSNSTFHISALVHPSTYLNKVVLGSKQGTLQLWNILKDQMLYSFTGWGSPITILQQVCAYRWFLYRCMLTSWSCTGVHLQVVILGGVLCRVLEKKFLLSVIWTDYNLKFVSLSPKILSRKMKNYI